MRIAPGRHCATPTWYWGAQWTSTEISRTSTLSHFRIQKHSSIFLLTDHTLRETALELEAGRYTQFVQALYELAELTCLYPPPREMMAFGDKGRLISNLDKIAHHFTKTTRPQTRRLSYLEPLPKDGVLKRGFSEGGNDVWLAEDQVHFPGDGQLIGERSWMGMTTGNGMIFKDFWLWQAYNSLLRDPKFGEVHVFMVGGAVSRMYWVWNTPPSEGGDDLADVKGKPVTQVIPLEELSSVPFIYLSMMVCTKCFFIVAAWLPTSGYSTRSTLDYRMSPWRKGTRTW